MNWGLYKVEYKGNGYKSDTEIEARNLKAAAEYVEKNFNCVEVTSVSLIKIIN